MSPTDTVVTPMLLSRTPPWIRSNVLETEGVNVISNTLKMTLHLDSQQPGVPCYKFTTSLVICYILFLNLPQFMLICTVLMLLSHSHFFSFILFFRLWYNLHCHAPTFLFPNFSESRCTSCG